MQKTVKTGLEGLLRPEDSMVVLIDHQPYQFTNLNSHEPTMVINNVVGLAKAAKVFKVPTILTTVIEERGGYIIKGLQVPGTQGLHSYGGLFCLYQIRIPFLRLPGGIYA
ncbi:MAG TPA: hypothetical protein VGE90_10740, partial [Chitinophaga sp.]